MNEYLSAAQEYIDAKALAVKLGVSIKQIRKWQAARRIPGMLILGHRLVRYRLAEIEKRLLSGNFLLPSR